jgi:archaellum component FlaC
MKQYNKLMEDLVKMSERSNNALKGHEPKCKICNSKYQKEVEHMYELNHPYKDIKAYLEDKEEFLSEMAISRHFKNHYPKRKAYFDNVKTMEDDSIQEAIEEYPRLEKIFHETMKEYDTDKTVYDEDGKFRNFEFVEKTYAYKFLNEMGFCFTRFSICNNTPKRELTDMEDVLTTIDNEMNKLDYHSYNESKKIDLLNRKLRCFKCKESSNSLIMEYMMHLLLKYIFNLDLEYWKFEEMFNLDVEYWNHEKMDNLLNKIKNGNSRV